MLARLALATAFFGVLGLVGAAKAPASVARGDGPDGRFDIDPVHTSVLFKIKHAGVSNFYGRFNDVGGKVLVDADKPEESSIHLIIQAASIDTHSPEREKHLLSSDFFNAEQFKTIDFQSETVKPKGAGKLAISGTLELHGVKKSITFEAEQTGYVESGGFIGTRVGYEAKFTIKRSDFGMKYALDVLGDDVEILISLEGAKAK